ncbi:MAG TPA: ATP-binding protein [Bryobacteraceae bacterium]|nr:ATP-binding protein [Bryobacteraceae bacterium]
MRSSLFFALLWAAAGFTVAALAVARWVGVESPQRALASAGILFGAGALTAWLLAREHRRRVMMLKRWADNLLEEPRPPDEEALHGDDEIGQLARSMQRIPPQIATLMQDLGAETARRDAILAGMQEALLAVDRELRVILCNDAFARFAGVPGPIPPGTPLVRLAREPELLDMINGALREGRTSSGRLEPGHGNQAWQITAGPLPMPTGRGAIALLHDITDLERLERVRRDFVANVSHELRTPLAAIRGYAETLLDGALEDEDNRFRFVEIILSHAIRLNNIASDLLALSELDAKQGREPPARVQLHAAIDSSVRSVAQEAARRDVRVVIPEACALEVLGYRTRLEQVLVNLLDNGIKFNRPGGEVRIEAAGEDEQVTITVTDTGIGIPSSDLPRIFERFYRVDKARSREVAGTGLGLSIVKHAVEQMNGSITLTSELGRGTTFRIVLPAAQPRDATAAVTVS